MDHESKINMLIKLLETNDNFTTNFEFFGGLLPNIGLEIFEKSPDSIVLDALKNTIFHFLRA
jgi:hypothetical protein